MTMGVVNHVEVNMLDLEKFLMANAQHLITKIEVWAKDFKEGKCLTNDGRMFNSYDLASRHQTVQATKGIILKIHRYTLP